MVPITEATQPGQPGYTWQQFESRLQDICQEHHDEGRALAFAIILHDETSPSISKVLQDRDYWDALNSLSGHLITVFSFETPAPKPQPRQFMTKVTTATYRPRHILQQYFGMPEVSLPAILFFQATKDGITDHCLAVLSAGTIHETDQALETVIRAAAESVNKVTPDNKGNYEEIFNLVKGALEGQDAGVQVWRALKAIRVIGQVDFDNVKRTHP